MNKAYLLNGYNQQSLQKCFRMISKASLVVNNTKSCRKQESCENLPMDLSPCHLTGKSGDIISTPPKCSHITAIDTNQYLNNRKIFLMQHGERIDYTFGTWIPYCFDEFSTYYPSDLNMPKSLPTRRNCPDSWKDDSPLTNIGIYQAKLIGEALLDSDVTINNVYCSPAYRCVQSCASVLEGLKQLHKCSIKLEPGLFEWMLLYPDKLPDWLQGEDLLSTNINIDTEYKAIITTEELQGHLKEPISTFYSRNNHVLTNIVSNTTGNIFIVAHTTTLDACARQLTGRKPRNAIELRKFIYEISYNNLGLITVEEINGTWTLVDPAAIPSRI